MNTTPRVLLIDIESSPNLSWIWGKYEQNALGDFISERQIIAYAWKWLGDKDVRVRSLPMYPGYKKNKHNNKALVADLHKLYSEADFVVGHNVSAFDEKMINTEFIVHGFKPPKRHRLLDTLLMARKYFRFNSNKLNDLGKRLKVGRKAHTGGFDLWAGCMNGNKKAWKTMEIYNKQDVVLLEKVFNKLKPWLNRPPLKRICVWQRIEPNRHKGSKSRN